jgi:hypothetical protein
VYIENDVWLSGITVPLEIRRLDQGQPFSKDSLAIIPANRLAADLTTTTHTLYLPSKSNELKFWRCDGIGFETRGTPDFDSTDAVMYLAAGASSEYLANGSDGTPASGNPSLLLHFGLSGFGGAFEIDTACVTPGNRLMFVDTNFTPIKPSFTKGTIAIGDCGCPCFADPNCDGVTDVVDVVQAVNVAFRNFPSVQDTTCASERTDVHDDGDGTTGVMDVVRFFNVAFRNFDPCSNGGFRDPCTP